MTVGEEIQMAGNERDLNKDMDEAISKFLPKHARSGQPNPQLDPPVDPSMLDLLETAMHTAKHLQFLLSQIAEKQKIGTEHLTQLSEHAIKAISTLNK
jgi:hypothetical protein